MGTGTWHWERKRERLKREIANHLDFLSGSVTTKGPGGGFILTGKEKGKTKSRYIRVAMLAEVRRMTHRHQQLKALLRELAEVNWQLLKLRHQK